LQKKAGASAPLLKKNRNPLAEGSGYKHLRYRKPFTRLVVFSSVVIY